MACEAAGQLSARRHSAAAMPLDKLDVWLQGRPAGAAADLPMLDSFVTAQRSPWSRFATMR
jgi:hypothetical protein